MFESISPVERLSDSGVLEGIEGGVDQDDHVGEEERHQSHHPITLHRDVGGGEQLAQCTVNLEVERESLPLAP